MKHARKSLVIFAVAGLLVGALALFLGKADAQEPSAEKLKVAFVSANNGADGSWLKFFLKDRDLVKSFFQDRVDFTYVDSVSPSPEAVATLSRLAREGHRLIFVTSPELLPMALETAERFQDNYFELIGHQGDADNIATYDGRFYEARYLLGRIAAQKSMTGLIGYVMPSRASRYLLNFNAFVLGVQSIRPDLRVVLALSGEPSTMFNEAEATRRAILEQVDVLSYETPSPAPLQVAEQNGVITFGHNYNLDMFAPQTQVTAILQDWSGYYINRINAVLEKRWTKNKLWAGMVDGAVNLAPFRYLDRKIIDDSVAKRQQFIDGQLKLFVGPLKDRDGAEHVKDKQMLTDADLKTMDWIVQGNIKIIELDPHK